MHHGYKAYKATPRKQRRQMITPNVIPNVKMRSLKEKKSFKAEQRSIAPEPPRHERPFESGARAEQEEDTGLRQAIRAAREVDHSPSSLLPFE